MEVESCHYDAYLIHGSFDKLVVEKVLKAVESHKIRCCYAPRDFKSTESTEANINEAVALSRCAVDFLSRNSIRENWCKHARELAVVKSIEVEDFVVIPAILDVKWSDLPYGYKARKTIQMDSQDFIPTLVKAIKGPTADPCYGELRSENENVKQENNLLRSENENLKAELQEMRQQLEDSNALIRQQKADMQKEVTFN
ncbi:toll-like receptor 5 [Lingula anatina]|uniref:Toll-like receptor 5 n=1 Tax=Lingula anatina TaxID=7574 RepID=A0A1S3H9T0_LINAN|nr:toll-like receptor 5 [Lingula anatina]|eukprot:XP_013382850.1 toll-like receptor 5 [Lingula anatina]